MKRLLIIALIVLMATPCLAALTTSVDNRGIWRNGYQWSGNFNKDRLWDWAIEIEDLLTGTTGQEFVYFDPTTEPTSTEGVMYYDAAAFAYKYYNGSSWLTMGTTAGGTSLDGSYDLGSGVTVDADAGAQAQALPVQ